DPLDRRIPHLRHRMDDFRWRAGACHRAVQSLRLRRVLPVPQPCPRLRRGRDRGDHHRRLRAAALPSPQSLRGGVEVTAIATAPARSEGFFSALAPRGKAVLFALTAIAVCLLFPFPLSRPPLPPPPSL